MMSGITLAIMRAAIKSEAIGSNIAYPVHLIRRVEMMTPTLPANSEFRQCVSGISDSDL